MFNRRDLQPPRNLEQSETISDKLVLLEDVGHLRQDCPTKIFLRCRSQYWASIFATIKDYIHSLTLDECLITDEVVGLLEKGGCRQLKVLNMPNNRITDKSIQHFKRLWSVNHLNLDNNPRLTFRGFISLLRQRGSQFEVLEMMMSSTKLEIRTAGLLQTADYYLRDKGLNWIIRNFPQLTELNVGMMSLISANDSVQASGAETIAAAYPRLAHLDIRSNDIGDQGALSLSSLRNLVRLSVATNRISYEGIKVLGANMPNLKSLDISQISLKSEENPIRDDGLRVIGHSFPNLLLLFMDDCEAGNQGLKQLSVGLVYLEWLHMTKNHCEPDWLTTMVKNLKYLQNLRIGERLSSRTNFVVSRFLENIRVS